MWLSHLRCLTLAFALALVPAAPSATLAQPAPAPNRSTRELLDATPLPLRDPVAIASRLRGGPIVPTIRGGSEGPFEVGRVDEFFVLDQSDNTYRTRRAELRLISPRVYWYVEVGQRVAPGDLARSAQFFEDRTYPFVHEQFGSEWSPGIDGDPRISVFIGTLSGPAGYFSSWDEYPRAAYPYSNERELILMSAAAARPGSSGFDATLAHEFQHLAHWHMNPAEEVWVDEGAAELAASLIVGGRGQSTGSFDRQPDLQLTAWGELARTGPHYQAAYLFMQYFAARYGGEEGLRGLFSEQARPPDSFNRYLARAGFGITFDDAFADWVVANLVDDSSVADGRFYHERSDPRMTVVGRLRVGDGPLEETVHQYGADYLELQGNGADAELVFEGDSAVPLVRVAPTSGSKLWWSNRADNMDAHMTRRVDLRAAPSATLRFNLWYETERDYDYFYVMASLDDGRTWRVLAGAAASDANPAGNAVGPGYSGASGGSQPTWIAEQVDLTPLVGHEVLIRLEYITDQGYNRRGVLIDDVQIPELGVVDDADLDQGWAYEGFLRSDNVIPQPWGLRLIEYGRNGVIVRPLAADPSGRAVERIGGLGSTVDRAVLAVSGLAPRTLETAGYRVTLRASP